MNNFLKIFCLIGLVLFFSCGGQKPLVTEEKVEELRVDYNKGKLETMEDIISVFQDPSQPTATRIAAMKALTKTEHPDAKEALKDYVKQCSELNYSLLTATVTELMKNQDPDKADAVIQGITTAQDKYIKFRTTVFEKIEKSNIEMQAIQLLKIYQIEKENYIAMQNSFTMLLGSMKDDKVIPILINIAKDRTIKPGTRSLAMEILGKKKHPMITEFFIGMLNNPDDQLQIRDFALEAIGDVKESRVILALLESYNSGKEEYYTLMHGLTKALGDYSDPKIAPALIDITLDNELPLTIRQDAISALIQYKDPEIFQKLLPMMENPDNYVLFDEMSEMALELDTKISLNQLRARAFQAQKSVGVKNEK